jgi:16S rRNA C967 or C1407 C5-methylase (RsmB/RsmF family)
LKCRVFRGASVTVGRSPNEEGRHSFPTWLAEAIAAAAPVGQLEAILAALNREPPLTFRVRPPGTRDALLAQLLAQGFEVEACGDEPDALRATTESRAIFESRWMKGGRLQVMDLGSQKLAAFCRAQPGQSVVDLCAGAGGKTLVLADAVGPKGRVYAWDSSARRLEEARRRVGEAKLVQVSFPKEPRLDLADLVLVDAPCSGSGTLGREPDQKWKLSERQVAEFAKTQESILDATAPKLKAGCSSTAPARCCGKRTRRWWSASSPDTRTSRSRSRCASGPTSSRAAASSEPGCARLASLELRSFRRRRPWNRSRTTW